MLADASPATIFAEVSLAAVLASARAATISAGKFQAAVRTSARATALFTFVFVASVLTDTSTTALLAEVSLAAVYTGCTAALFAFAFLLVVQADASTFSAVLLLSSVLAEFSFALRLRDTEAWRQGRRLRLDINFLLWFDLTDFFAVEWAAATRGRRGRRRSAWDAALGLPDDCVKQRKGCSLDAALRNRRYRALPYDCIEQTRRHGCTN